MKKLIAFVLLLALFFIGKTSLSYATWVDPTLIDHAAALDKARGWDCPPPASSTNTAPTADQDSSNQQVNMEGYSNTSVNALMANMIGAITGAGRTNCTDKERRKELQQTSAIGTTGKLIATMYSHPPASGIEYIASSLRNFGIVDKAYAQGIGYSGLAPLQPIWRAFRNLAYVILVIVLVVIGFMVMFRMKLNAQTAITIQTALPNIVLTLILITFSYAIAGLLIDLMYFSIMIIISVFHQIGLAQQLNGFGGFSGIQEQPTSWYQEYYVNANTWDLMGSVVNWETIAGLPSALIGGSLGGLFQRMIDASNFSQAVPQAFTFIIGGSVSLLGSIVLVFLIALGLLIIFVQLFFIFLNSYIQIILSVVLAPLQLLVGAIPGRNTFRNWIMGLIGNLAVFPAAVALFMLNMHISVAAIREAGTDTAGNLWSAPFLLGSPQGQVDASLPMALIGMGILMLTPSLLRTVKNLFAPKPFLPISPGVIFSPLVSAGQGGMNIAQQRYYLGQTLATSPFARNSIVRGLLGIKQP